MAAGSRDLLAWMMGWNSHAPGVPGVFQLVAAQVYVDGPVAAQTYMDGPVERQVYVDGAVEGQVQPR